MKDISKRMRGTVKVAHIWRKRKTYRVPVRRSKRLVRYQLRFERNTKICLRIWKGVELIHLLEDRWK